MRSVEDRLAFERRGPQLRRRPAQERVDEEELVEVELSRTARRSKPCLHFEHRAAARRQRPFRGDPAAGDEERPHVARVLRREQDAGLELPYAVEALQLAADSLERRHSVAEPARVLESLRVRQLA